jgi:hypothetical protein
MQIVLCSRGVLGAVHAGWLLCSLVSAAQAAAPPKLHHAGQIFIVGNERTGPVILRQGPGPRYPEEILTYPDIRQDEHNPDSEFKDIVISVQEGSTGSLMFGVGVNSDSGLTGSIVVNERNFDITDPLADLPEVIPVFPTRDRE